MFGFTRANNINSFLEGESEEAYCPYAASCVIVVKVDCLIGKRVKGKIDNLIFS